MCCDESFDSEELDDELMVVVSGGCSLWNSGIRWGLNGECGGCVNCWETRVQKVQSWVSGKSRRFECWQ